MHSLRKMLRKDEKFLQQIDRKIMESNAANKFKTYALILLNISNFNCHGIIKTFHLNVVKGITRYSLIILHYRVIKKLIVSVF